MSCAISTILHLYYHCRVPSSIQSLVQKVHVTPDHSSPQMEYLGRALDYDLQRTLCPLSHKHCLQ